MSTTHIRFWVLFFFFYAYFFHIRFFLFFYERVRIISIKIKFRMKFVEEKIFILWVWERDVWIRENELNQQANVSTARDDKMCVQPSTKNCIILLITYKRHKREREHQKVKCWVKIESNDWRLIKSYNSIVYKKWLSIEKTICMFKTKEVTFWEYIARLFDF